MKNSMYPCLWFDGQAKAAAELYCSVFENSRITMHSPMVVNFELNGQKFMGLNGGPVFTINPSISMSATFDSVQKVNKVWDKLADGGKVMNELMKMKKMDIQTLVSA